MLFKTAWHRFCLLSTTLLEEFMTDIWKIFHLYKQWNLNSKARKIFTFAASHVVIKGNFTVVAQPSLTGNCFSWDLHSKGTTESLQVVVLANSIHFSRHATSSCKYNSSGLAASCEHFRQTFGCFSDHLPNTTTASVLKPPAMTQLQLHLENLKTLAAAQLTLYFIIFY